MFLKLIFSKIITPFIIYITRIKSNKIKQRVLCAKKTNCGDDDDTTATDDYRARPTTIDFAFFLHSFCENLRCGGLFILYFF